MSFLLSCGNDTPTESTLREMVTSTPSLTLYFVTASHTPTITPTVTSTPTLTFTATPVVVTFVDANFEAAIRSALSKPTGDIYDTDMQTITSLFAGALSISDISGIEYCTNLATLQLYENSISDISDLAGLVNLTTLQIYSNSISDLSALEGLLELNFISLYDNNISEITALVNNLGVGSMDQVYLQTNPLSAQALSDISILQGRGATVTY